MNTYEINGQKVSQKEFEELFNSLKGKEKWFCDDTTYGGVEYYEAKDSQGRVYQVSLQTGAENLQSLTLKK